MSQDTPPVQESHFDKVWKSLWCYFQATFIIMLILIVVFGLGMIAIVYRTTNTLENASATSNEPPELMETAAKPGMVPPIIVQDSAKLRTSEAMALISTLQISLAMFLGFTCIFWGLLMTCLGVTAGYDIKASGNTDKSAAQFSIASTSPGILFLAGGLLLIGMALFKEIQYQDKTVVPYTGGTLPPIQESEAEK